MPEPLRRQCGIRRYDIHRDCRNGLVKHLVHVESGEQLLHTVRGRHIDVRAQIFIEQLVSLYGGVPEFIENGAPSIHE